MMARFCDEISIPCWYAKLMKLLALSSGLDGKRRAALSSPPNYHATTLTIDPHTHTKLTHFETLHFTLHINCAVLAVYGLRTVQVILVDWRHKLIHTAGNHLSGQSFPVPPQNSTLSLESWSGVRILYLIECVLRIASEYRE